MSSTFGKKNKQTNKWHTHAHVRVIQKVEKRRRREKNNTYTQEVDYFFFNPEGEFCHFIFGCVWWWWEGKKPKKTQ